MINRRRLLEGLALAATALTRPSRAQATDYPSRPLRWIVGFPAGGAADIIARIIAAQMSDQLRQQVVVENRPGAGTSLAASALLSTAPDGYTMLMLGSSTIVHALLHGDGKSSILQHIVPVAGLTTTAFVVAVHGSAPYATLAGLIEDAKANPGRLRIGSYGVGTQSQLAAQAFSQATGIDVVHVPYRGGAPLVADLLGRHIHVAFDTVASSLPHLKDGNLRALAVTRADRLKILPDIPAVAETLPGYEMAVWTGIGVATGTPSAIVQRLSREVRTALTDTGIRKRLADLAIDPLPYDLDEFSAFWSAETDRTRGLIQKTGIMLR
jgi:tripartite-type tricarboxylate transporter receptor subunit TctC